MKHKLLITGFDPFGGETVNPSWEAVDRLPDAIGDLILTKLQIPTVFGKAAELVIDAAERIDADFILCVGQAGGRAAVTPEYTAINLRHAGIPDNDGNMPQETPVRQNAPDGMFSTVPVMRMAEAVQAAGYPAAVSYHAGTFVCNDLLFTLLHHYKHSQKRIGFIHVPFLPEQAKEQQPSMSLENICGALRAAVACLSSSENVRE